MGDPKSEPEAENGQQGLKKPHCKLESRPTVNFNVKRPGRQERLGWKVSLYLTTCLLSSSLTLMIIMVPGIHASTASLLSRHLELDRIGKMIQTIEHVEQKMDEMELSMAMIDTKDPTYDGLLEKKPLFGYENKDGFTDHSNMYSTFKEAHQWRICDVWSKYEEIWKVYEKINGGFSCDTTLKELKETFNQLVPMEEKRLRDHDQNLELNLKQQQQQNNQHAHDYDEDENDDDFFDLVQNSSGEKMNVAVTRLLKAKRKYYNTFDPQDLPSFDLLFDEIMDKMKTIQEIAKDYY